MIAGYVSDGRKNEEHSTQKGLTAVQKGRNELSKAYTCERERLKKKEEEHICESQALCKRREDEEALEKALEKPRQMGEFQHLCKVNEVKSLREAAQQCEEELVFITAVLEKERREDAEEETAKERHRQECITQREQLLEELREVKEDEKELDRLITLEN